MMEQNSDASSPSTEPPWEDAPHMRHGYQSPLSKPNHPASVLMKGKSDRQIESDIHGMIGKKSPANVFMRLCETEAQHAESDRGFYLYESAIAQWIGASEKTVQRALHVLRDKNLIRIAKRRTSNTASHPANHYWIDWVEFCGQMNGYYSGQTRSSKYYPEVDAVFGPAVPPDKMTALDIQRNNARPEKRVVPQSRRRSFASSTTQDRSIAQAIVNWASAHNEGVEEGMRTFGHLLSSLRGSTDRKPEPGDPEKIFLTKYRTIPPEMEEWLRTDAMQSPLLDLLIAVAVASRLCPTEVRENLELLPPASHSSS